MRGFQGMQNLAWWLLWALPVLKEQISRFIIEDFSQSPPSTPGLIFHHLSSS
jgi:hypothetical protein